jgi:hypothetical protein
VLANLARMPDYTCRLSIERSLRRHDARRFRAIDAVHIEVGYVDGKELYAWPGQKFEDKALDQLMPAGGAVGTGDFALHVNYIFRGNAATFTYAGRGVQEGRQAVQFDYRVPRPKSKYVVVHGSNMAVVGYHGSFWADAGTLLLIRLQIETEEIPAKLKTKRAGSTVTYGLTRIGASDFLLPLTSELFLVDTNGDERRNLTRFEQCRQYQGESVVSFAEPVGGAEAPKPVTEVHLPPGMLVEMTLKTPIMGERAVIGDPVKAEVPRDVVKAGTVIIPKGARVTGRITRIKEVSRGRIPYRVVGLQFSTLEFDGGRAEFLGSLESLAFAGAQYSLASAPYALAPGEGMVFVKGNVLHIPAGVHMVWRTLEGE